MYIRENLRWIRSKHGMSRNEVQRNSGIYESIIRKIEEGTNKEPSIRTIVRICEYFNISIDDFVKKDLTKRNQLKTKSFEIYDSNQKVKAIFFTKEDANDYLEYMMTINVTDLTIKEIISK